MPRLHPLTPEPAVVKQQHLVIRCPACGSPQGERCRTLKTGRPTDTHSDRIVDSARVVAGHPSSRPVRHLYLVPPPPV